MVHYSWLLCIAIAPDVKDYFMFRGVRTYVLRDEVGSILSYNSIGANLKLNIKYVEWSIRDVLQTPRGTVSFTITLSSNNVTLPTLCAVLWFCRRSFRGKVENLVLVSQSLTLCILR